MSAKAAPSRKWRRRAEARPNEILDAALTEFQDRGFDAARVEDIARKAGISKAGVYLYFETKEAILRALIEREVTPVARRLRALADAGADDPVAALRALLTAIANLAADPKMFAVPRIVISMAARYPEIAEHYRAHVVEEGLAAVKNLHREGARRGLFRPCDSDVVARAAIGPVMIHGFYTQLLLGAPGDLSPAERAAATLDIFLNGLAAEAA